MERTPQSRMTKRAALLASTAIIALLSACQSSGDGPSTMPATSSSGGTAPTYHYGGMGGYGW